MARVFKDESGHWRWPSESHGTHPNHRGCFADGIDDEPDPTNNKLIFQTKLTVECHNRLETVEIVAQLPPLDGFIGEPGVYLFQVVCDETIIGSHRITAELSHETSDQGNKGNDNDHH